MNRIPRLFLSFLGCLPAWLSAPSCSSAAGLGQSAVTTAQTAPASVAATANRTLQSIERMFR